MINQEENDIQTNIDNYITSFSFPRLAGTKGEEKAVALTNKTFKSIGYNEEEMILQNFKFSTFYSEELIKIIGFMNIIVILTLLFIKYLYPFFFVITIGISLIAFLSMFKVLKHPELKGFWERHFGTLISSTNVITKVQAKNLKQEEAGNLIVSAHLDSKSQTFKTVWRVIFFTIWEFGIILLIGLFTIFIIDLYFGVFKSILLILEISLIITSSFVIFSIIMIMIIKTGNVSAGSLDNATGMAVVFELSSHFKQNPLHNYNLWFCQFSAEEIGTMGSRFFVDNHKDMLIKDNVFQINFDMVSCKDHTIEVEFIKSYGILPKKISDPLLISFVHDIAKEKDLQVKGHTLLSGAHTDSVPFHQLNIKTIDFTTPLAAKYSHNILDQPDKVDIDVISKTFILVKDLILKLDKSSNEFLNL
jgi:hypothetical protein